MQETAFTRSQLYIVIYIIIKLHYEGIAFIL